MKKVFLLLALASMIVACGGSSKNEGAPKSTVATVDTLASSSDTFNLAMPEATKLVTQPNNEIWYTSSDGKVVKPCYEGKGIFGAVIVSNTYKDGKGIIKFKGDVTTIGENAFYGCESLNSVTIPDSVTTIGDDAFAHCDSLTSVTIPNSVTTIGGSAFWGCSILTSVTIPNSITTIEMDAFGGCSSLKEFNSKFASEDGRCLIIDGELVAFAPAGITKFTIPDSVTTIGEKAFCKCKSLKSVTIPNSVTTIGNNAFEWCSNLKSVTIPNSVTTIGGAAFYYCESLTSVTMPNSVTTIGKYAFLGCDSLNSVTIPNSVTTIGEWAFYKCNNLSYDTKYKIKSINPNAL